MDISVIDTNLLATQYIDVLRSWEDNQQTIIVWAVVAAISVLLWIGLNGLNNRRQASVRGYKMHPKRERYINECIGDYITDAVETAVARGEVTRAEARMIYRRCANIFNDRTFLPRGGGNLTLKESLTNKHKTQPELKAFLLAKHGYKLNGRKPDIPGEKPLQVIKPAPIATNRFARAFFNPASSKA